MPTQMKSNAPSLAACLADYRIVGEAQLLEPVLVRPRQCKTNGASSMVFHAACCSCFGKCTEAQHIKLEYVAPFFLSSLLEYCSILSLRLDLRFSLNEQLRARSPTLWQTLHILMYVPFPYIYCIGSAPGRCCSPSSNSSYY